MTTPTTVTPGHDAALETLIADSRAANPALWQAAFDANCVLREMSGGRLGVRATSILYELSRNTIAVDADGIVRITLKDGRRLTLLEMHTPPSHYAFARLVAAGYGVTLPDVPGGTV